jgi:hypothetical protein
MAVVVKTFSFPTDAEGLIDLGYSESINFGWDASGAIKFTVPPCAGIGSWLEEWAEYESVSEFVEWSAAKTWEDLGVPAGKLVTHCQIAYKYKQVSVGGATIQQSNSRVYLGAYSGVDYNQISYIQYEAGEELLPGTVDSSFQIGTPSADMEILPRFQPSDTPLCFGVSYGVCATDGFEGTIEFQIDDIELTITYEDPLPVTLDWWSAGEVSPSYCIGAYTAKGATDQATSYLNKIQNLYNMETTSAPTWEAVGGWTFDGVSQFLSAAYLWMNSGMTFVVRFSNGANASAALFDTGHLGYRIRIRPRHATDFCINAQYSTSDVNSVPAVAGGVLILAGNTLYVDGVARAEDFIGAAYAPGGNSNDPISLAKGQADFYGCKIQAFAFYQGVFTAEQAAAVTTAMDELYEVPDVEEAIPSRRKLLLGVGV